MSLIPVEGQKDLYRDTRTNAIINTNKNDYESYISRKKLQELEKMKIKSMESDLQNIKDDLDEIKKMIRGLSK